MAEYKREFIKIPTDKTNGFQTMPVEPHKRLKNEEIVIQLCEEKDLYRISEGIYTAFPEAWWSKREPPELRPPEKSTRIKRFAERLRPTFTIPLMNWVKAVYVPTGEIVGIAGWAGPGMPAQNVFSQTAVGFYGWREKMGWSDEEYEEMWKGVDIPVWNEEMDKNDAIRREVLGDEPHWFLGPLLTFPEFQGRGVGTKLMNWAIEQADANEPYQPMYLESAPTARAVYMRFGFKPQGAYNFLRRGPAIVRGLEAEEVEKVDVNVVERETEADLAS